MAISDRITLPINEVELRRHVKMYRYLKVISDPYARIRAIEAYLKRWDIKSVVVGVSGGVDSALVLAMLSEIKDITVHAVTIDFDLYHDVFESKYIDDLKAAFDDRKNIFWHQHNLSDQYISLAHAADIAGDAGVHANVTYAMRYLVLFGYAQKVGGITFGTTNRDEFGYAGWFGKNSDMMVDVQPISDLHKFEVTTWAEILGVPQSITERVPTGDLLDGSSDEENFGCTYDELSYLTYLMQKKVSLNDFMGKRFKKVHALHHKNAHKYQGQKFNPVFITG